MERMTVTALTLSAALLVALAAPSNAGIIYLTAESAGSNFSHLVSYDTGTGTQSDLGMIQGRKYTTDLACNADGGLYGVGWSNAGANGTAHLFRITPDSDGSGATWSMETVKSNRMDRTVNSAVFDDQGALYVASAYGSLQKLQLDRHGRQWEVVASADMDWGAAGDLAFSADGADLYVSLAGGKLGKVNFDADSNRFGRVSVIGDTGYDNLYGLAMVDGTLYGTTAGRGNYDNSYLVELDPETASACAVTYLGTGVWGAASGGGGQAVPEPASLMILALGGLALPIRRAIRRRTR
ncbi:MAG TPA: hypothetical protein VFJ30_17875 [Phycisphaerae bacterium]|nr:hypothetical protein [Phycisphaerae bacterium]